MPLTLLFHAGFLGSPTLWQGVIPLIQSNHPFIKIHVVEPGYFSSTIPSLPHMEEPIVGISHSLGFLKLLHLTIPLNGCIGIQSFFNFTTTPDESHLLTELIRLFERNMNVGCRYFYKKSRLTPHTYTFLNRDLIMMDLLSLHSPYVGPIAHYPLFFLITDKDPIISANSLQKQFKGYPLYMTKGEHHALPEIDPEFCYHHIMTFIQTHFQDILKR